MPVALLSEIKHDDDDMVLPDRRDMVKEASLSLVMWNTLPPTVRGPSLTMT